VTPGGSSAAGGLWGYATELGEGFLVADALWVVSGGDKELAGEFDADAEEVD
jgi:hypothetical protein